jgi:phosphopantothenoylcysteine decarboxylase/phosphopantothenate--cysteine ligase
MSGKTIGIGITGGIASYKMAELVSRLKKLDFEVVVMMTKSAARFITPLTFRSLTGREVLTSLWTDSEEWKIPHIDVAESLDLLVVAPATANIVGKMAGGIADDFLSTVCLACTAPVLVVPAMNTNMYLHPAVQDNLARLQQRGVQIMPPDSGKLACGTEGIGRLPETDAMLAVILGILEPAADLAGKTVLVNAGATREDIDPVRYISNRSSGKMGYALAEAAVKRGAEVILVSGPTALTPPERVQLVPVWSVEEMFTAMRQYQPRADIIIGAAAVGDFKPAESAGHKLKKADNERLFLELVGTTDILKELGRIKLPGQLLIGFAAETDDVATYARRKLDEKNLDLVVANDVTLEGAGFDADTNIVTLIGDGFMKPLPKLPKSEVAHAILDAVLARAAG